MSILSATEWSEPVLGRDLHPQLISALHGAGEMAMLCHLMLLVPLLDVDCSQCAKGVEDDPTLVVRNGGSSPRNLLGIEQD